jgi:hypothetical protein
MTKKNKEKVAFDFQVDFFEYVLASPVGYASAGSLLKTDRVTLNSPLVKHLIKSMALSQLVNIATMKASSIFQAMKKYASDEDIKLLEDQKKEEQQEETAQSLGEQARTIILGSDINFEKAVDKFKDLAFAGCLRVEKNTINVIQWDEISEPDKVEMFFQFVGVFILPSLFAAPKEEKGSKK